MPPKKGIFAFSYHILIFLTSLFIVNVCNQSFFSSLLKVFPLSKVAYTWAFMIFAIALCLEILCVKWLSKAVMMFFIIFSSFCAYFIDSLNIGITPDILQSLFNTHLSEAQGFLSFGFFSHLLFFALLPCGVIGFLPLTSHPPLKSCFQKIFVIILYALLSFVLWSFCIGKDLIYLFTTQHRFQYITTPISPIRSAILLHAQKQKLSMPYTQVALDAKLPQNEKSKILILVIGESLRGTQLHNYSRELLPQTKTHSNLVNFSDFSSCGVITAISVPCMLTAYTHKTYTNRYLSNFTDNILDIAQRVGIKTFWLDSNSGDAQSCIGAVCKRMKDVYYFEGLDEKLFEKFFSLTQGLKADTNYFFVLHTFGSHGPDYFNRYPKEFEIYKPICKERNPNLCTTQELINAYDNSALYTDSLLHRSIQRLEALQKDFDVSLWYVSDHGESLGELGNYMHGGLPYSLAPKHQTQVGALAWFGERMEEKYQIFKQKQNSHLSQDYIFHSILGFFGIQTKIYNKSLDLGN